MAIPSAETLGNTESVLLIFELPGRVFRYTSGPEPLTVTNAAGSEFLFLPGFSRVALERVAGQVDSGLSVQVYAQGVDSWADLRARGHRFELMRATVLHHYVGQVLESAEVYESGRAVDPGYGDETEPLTFKIESQLSASGSFPQPTRRVDDQTFAVGTIDPEVYGVTYPVIIGHPGLVSGSVPAPTTPAYLVLFISKNSNSNRWLIGDGELQATSATMTNITTGESAVLDVLQDTDLLNQVYSYVDSSGWGLTNLGDEYRIAFDVVGSGGVYNATRTAPLRGAGEVMLYLLQTYAPHIRIDVGRMEAQRAYFDAYKLDIGTTAIVNVWPFIAGNILPMIPADIAESTDGLYFQHRALDAPLTAVVGEVIDSTPGTGNIQRTSRMSGGGGDIANRITLLFGRGGEDQRFLKSVTIDAEPVENDTQTLPSYRCAESQRLFEDPAKPGSGVRPLVLESKIIYDDATASLIVRDKALELALPPELIELQGGTMWDARDVNDVVLYRAEDLKIFTPRRALVRRKVAIEDGIELTLLLLEAPFGPEVATS